LGDMQDGFHDMEINLKMCYSSNDHVECSIEGSGSDFDSKKRIKEEIEAKYDKKKNEEILERNSKQYDKRIYNKMRTIMMKDM
jgi:hypothetical protein